jgi:hypothetical protein
MKQSIESADPKQVLEFGNDKTPVELGGFQDISWKRLNQKISLGIDYEAKHTVRFVDDEGDLAKTSGTFCCGCGLLPWRNAVDCCT